MLFSSLEFLFLFLPLTWFVVWVVPAGSRAGVLLAASMFFYGWWDWRYVPLILLSIGINYIIGNQLMLQTTNQRVWLGVGVAFNLILLGFFKYLGFTIRTVNSILESTYPVLEWALPLGISFFTFQQIAYLVDAKRGRVKASEPPALVRYALFVTFFPQLIAGPIVHHKEIFPQLTALEDPKWKLRNRYLARGLFLLSLGLFKKLVIADNLLPWIDPVFSNPVQADAYAAWVASIGYSLQLYFDFSAYSEMAMGIALLFGVRLPLNFNSPYKSASIQEFWRRWHITLGRFLKDYLYVPLGGSRHGIARTIGALMITMLLGGLWHGAGWNFVFWGALHGLFLVIFLVWRQLPFRLPRYLAVTITFMFVLFSWVPFRAENMSDALILWQAMLGLNGLEAPVIWSSSMPGWFESGDSIFDFRGHELFILLALLAIVMEAPNAYEISRRIRPRFRSWLVPVGALLASIYFIGSPSAFVYFNF